MHRLCFEAVLVVCSIGAQISTAKAAAQELQLWDSNELPWSRMVLNKDCAVQTKVMLRSCRYPPVFPLQSSFVLCLGRLTFLIVDLSFRGQGLLLQVGRQPRSSDGFSSLGSHPGLANCTGASIEGVIVARCTGCSSKLCLLFDPLQPRSLQQTRCPCRLCHWSPDLYSKGGCTRITTLGQQRTTLV